MIDLLHDYDTIMLYLSLDDEVSCDSLIQELLLWGKTILVPYGEWDAHEAVQLHSFDELSIGKRWIRTVKDKEIRSDSIDCIVCPGRLFTRDGQRKGRGGWWYDRFLARHPESYKIWICREDKIVEYLEQRSWDVKMDKVISMS